MISAGINFKQFKYKKKTKKIKNILNKLLFNKNQVLESLSINYKYSYNNKYLKKYKNSSNFRVIGMGGSTLGAQAIYDFLKYKIKKKFIFSDNLISSQKKDKKNSLTLLFPNLEIQLKLL